MNSVQNPSKYLRFCTETSRVGASLRWWKSPCGVSLPELRTVSPQRITGQGSRWGLEDQRNMRGAPLLSNSTHHASATQAHQGCDDEQVDRVSIGSFRARAGTAALRPNLSARREGRETERERKSDERSDLTGQIDPEPRSDAPVLWSWSRMIAKTRLIWQRT